MPSESLISSNQSSGGPDDLGSLTLYIAKLIPIKLIIFLFISNIALQTNSFIESILNKFDGAVDGRYPTEKGIFIQTLLLCLIFTIVYILNETSMHIRGRG